MKAQEFFPVFLKRLDYIPSLKDETQFDFHLQWFAAEDEGRTEDPTEQKIKKAREEGKVAKSADLTASIILLFSLLLILLLSPYMMEQFMGMMRYFLTISVQKDITTDRTIPRFFLNYILKLSLPIMGIAFLSALIGNILQVGFLFSPKAITPDFKKIAPDIIKWAKKSFFSSESFMNTAKSFFKIGIIGFISYWNVKNELPQITNLVYSTVPLGAKLIVSLAGKVMLEAAIVLLVLALPDYLFQRYQHKESLKMTKQEVKEEMKQSEGDPMVKGRMKQKMRDLLTNQMVQNVPKADVVITNPTHFAVALEYEQSAMTAPRVSAKGMDEVAQRIKKIAKENDVPLVENVPLARALYANVEIGDEIPAEYYSVVSEILVNIYKLNGKMN